jgi:ankyrin repeat protein
MSSIKPCHAIVGIVATVAFMTSIEVNAEQAEVTTMNSHAKHASAQVFDKFLIHQSVSSGDIETLRYLLDHGAKVDQRSIIDQATPLHIASYSGDEAITRLLMARGADINAAMIGGNTPLHMALAGGHAAIAKFLLVHGAEPNVNLSNKGSAPLHLAARAGFASMVELLLQRGADANARVNSNHATALIEAARYGHVLVVETLLRFGADVAKRDLDGRSALDVAQKQGHIKIVDLLSQSRP